MNVDPFTHGSAVHTDIWKTQGLRQALDKYGFDAAFGGARRDEEKSRAKERIFSFRSAQHRWDLKNFTGIDSPYERPENPDVRIDTTVTSAEDAAESIVARLRVMGTIDQP